MNNTIFENSAVRATVDINSDIDSDHVAVVELMTPPNNFFSLELIGGVADAFEALDADDRCRSILLCADGKHFCAGADHAS
ncbi:MAG: enoyl-CoA hydratase/carnithine racemase, partial [Ilumatobacter sp.]